MTFTHKHYMGHRQAHQYEETGPAQFGVVMTDLELNPMHPAYDEAKAIELFNAASAHFAGPNGEYDKIKLDMLPRSFTKEG